MTAAAPERDDVAELLDVERFAETVLGRRLWPHQADAATSTARYRVICAGRQVGKSSLLSVLSLHRATIQRNALVLVISAGEVAARRLLADIADLATSSPLLRGSVLDESAGSLTLSNGSRIIAVPASMRQVRGWPVDLLIMDEAAFIENELWRAAEPAIIARPGSQIVLTSSPWGGMDHFFRALWTRGMDRPDEQVASWHWPSSVSPMVDDQLLEEIRAREAPDYFAREFLAEWIDDAGAFFTTAEIMNAVTDTPLVDPDVPGLAGDWPMVAGVDWGQSRDANAIATVAALDPRSCADRRWRLWLPYLEARHGGTWSEWIDHLVTLTDRLWLRVLASERNGVGSYPTEDLRDRLRRVGPRRNGPVHVRPVWTDAHRKQSGFGKMKGLLQADRLLLPRHPELLKQLRALEFEQMPGGSMRIAVPEHAGHDDLAMALMQAVSCVDPRRLDDWRPGGPLRGPTIETGGGATIAAAPLALDSVSWIRAPEGQEGGDGW